MRVVTEQPGLKVPVTPASVGAFLCLLALLYQAHELGHHFFGGIVCGQLGEVSLSTFTSAEGCSRPAKRATELFGPLVSFGIAYGAGVRLRARPSLTAFGCVFASYFQLRWVPPLLGGGDELDAARQLGFGIPPLIVAALLLVSLPPVLTAWRAVSPSGRAWRVGLAYALPLPFLLYVDALASRVSGPGAAFAGLARVQVLHVPASLLLLDISFGVGLLVLGRRVRRERPLA